jgi:hypothetical protein
MILAPSPVERKPWLQNRLGLTGHTASDAQSEGRSSQQSEAPVRRLHTAGKLDVVTEELAMERALQVNKLIVDTSRPSRGAANAECFSAISRGEHENQGAVRSGESWREPQGVSPESPQLTGKINLSRV